MDASVVASIGTAGDGLAAARSRLSGRWTVEQWPGLLEPPGTVKPPKPQSRTKPKGSSHKESAAAARPNDPRLQELLRELHGRPPRTGPLDKAAEDAFGAHLAAELSKVGEVTVSGADLAEVVAAISGGSSPATDLALTMLFQITGAEPATLQAPDGAARPASIQGLSAAQIRAGLPEALELLGRLINPLAPFVP